MRFIALAFLLLFVCSFVSARNPGAPDPKNTDTTTDTTDGEVLPGTGEEEIIDDTTNENTIKGNGRNQHKRLLRSENWFTLEKGNFFLFLDLHTFSYYKINSSWLLLLSLLKQMTSTQHHLILNTKKGCKILQNWNRSFLKVKNLKNIWW